MFLNILRLYAVTLQYIEKNAVNSKSVQFLTHTATHKTDVT